MADIIKTWPAGIDTRTTAGIFRPRDGGFAEYYFTLGRGRPQQEIQHIWFTWRSRILGSFAVDRVVQNDGSLPRLTRLDGEDSDWQIKRDAWVAICRGTCQPLKERVFMGGFRGWRYFDLDTYRSTPGSRFRI